MSGLVSDRRQSRPRFGVWAPVYGNHGARLHPLDPPDAGYRRTRDLLVRAERAGFDARGGRTTPTNSPGSR